MSHSATATRPTAQLPKPAPGTRGVRTPPPLVARGLKPLLIWMHKRSGNQFRGFDIVYLTTVGARTGKSRTTPVARFDDAAGGWIVVASASGAATHPAWYHNVAAHPDQVVVEVDGMRHEVVAEQLEGKARDRAWDQVVRRVPDFATYAEKTDRQIPLLRMTRKPVDA